MDKAQKEQEYFLSGIRNLFALCEKQGCPKFSAFLTEEQQASIQPVVKKLAAGGYQVLFWGGYPEAQRKILGVFPDYIPPDPADFPLVGYTASFPEAYALSHRDVLGTLMGQQIRRETIGDIVVQPGKAVIFAEERVEKVLGTQISRIGGVGVRMEKGFVPFTVAQQFAQRSGTFASLRLDAAVAFCAGLSREKAAALIAAGLCSLNHLEKKEQSAPVSQGDILVIRGKGKFRLETISGPTRKGRIGVTFLQYL